MSTITCNICGPLPAETLTKRLVRDHNHNTGFIRGMLCDACNNFIGMYESKNPNYAKKAKKKKKYTNWLNTYYHRITEHLTTNTGIKYCRIK